MVGSTLTQYGKLRLQFQTSERLTNWHLSATDSRDLCTSDVATVQLLLSVSSKARGRDYFFLTIRGLECKSRSKLLHLVLSQELSANMYCTGSIFPVLLQTGSVSPLSLLYPPPFQVPACILPLPCTMSPSLQCTRSHESPVPAVHLPRASILYTPNSTRKTE